MFFYQLLFSLALLTLSSCLAIKSITESDLKLSDLELIETEQDMTKSKYFIPEDEGEIVINDNDTEQEEQEIDSVNLVQAAEINLGAHQNTIDQYVNISKEKLLNYIVKGPENLIYTSFKIYGTIKMWRVLALINKDQLAGSYELKKGMVLQYPSPKNAYTRPIGKPFLIKPGDSLSLISDLVYGDYKKWPTIWKNNPRMINDPNLIFAGFTLFYPAPKAHNHEIALY